MKHILLILILAGHAPAQTLWQNPTRLAPVDVTFGKTATATGTVRVQKIHGTNGPLFPHVLLPERPIQVRLTGEDLRGNPPVPPDEPMRIVVLIPADKRIAATLEKAEGKQVGLTYVLNSANPDVNIHTVNLFVKRVRIVE